MSKLYSFIRHQVGQYGDSFGNRITRSIQAEQKQAIKEIYESERKQYADQARKQFNALCHQGKIKKEQLKMIRSLLETLLGSYTTEYRGMEFDNEFHRIYTMLKSYHLDKSDWDKILTALEQIQYSS